jgi:hypothetical protein
MCNYLEGLGNCTSDMDCYINLSEYDNCFHHYKYFINGTQHTLHQCATLLGTSHTNIANLEKIALDKLKELLKNNKT